MANLIEVKVPDIGDFADIPVIEIFVKPGDTIKKEASLISLESDKATMEVPSTHAGVVKELKVKLGDKVSMGSLVLVLDAAEAVAPAPASSPKAEAAKAPAAPATPAAAVASIAAPVAGKYTGNVDVDVRNAGAGRGPGRLFRRFPRGRPGHEDRHRRALCAPRRRVPECRLHSIQGAVARRGGRRRSQRRWPSTASPSASRRSTWISCAAGRTKSSAS